MCMTRITEDFFPDFLYHICPMFRPPNIFMKSGVVIAVLSLQHFLIAARQPINWWAF